MNERISKIVTRIDAELEKHLEPKGNRESGYVDALKDIGNKFVEMCDEYAEGYLCGVSMIHFIDVDFYS